MLKVIGKNGCGACVILKEKLINEGVEFEYLQFEDIDVKARREYVAKSRNAGIQRFPMVFKDDEVVANIDSLFE